MPSVCTASVGGKSGIGGCAASVENLRAPPRCGGGGVGTRSWIERPELTDARRRDVDCLRMSACRSMVDIRASEGTMIVRRTIVFGLGSCCPAAS